MYVDFISKHISWVAWVDRRLYLLNIVSNLVSNLAFAKFVFLCSNTAVFAAGYLESEYYFPMKFSSLFQEKVIAELT